MCKYSTIRKPMPEKNGKRLKVRHIIIRKAPILLLARLIIVLLVFSVFHLLLTFIIVEVDGSTFGRILSATQLLLFVITILWMTYLIFMWRNEYYKVEKKGIVHRKGVLYRRERSYSCSNVESITLRQDLIGKIFRYGTIVLYDPALKKKIYLRNITRPVRSVAVLKDVYLHIKTDTPQTFITR